MSLPISAEMATPVPKPRARYKLGVGLRNQPSSERDVSCDFPDSETAGKQELDNEAENHDKPAVIPNGSCDGLLVNPTLHGLNEDTSISRNGAPETFVWPASPPYSSTGAPDTDIKTLSEWAKEPGSDSSNDERPMTPDSPKSDDVLTDRDTPEPNSYPNTNSSVSQVSDGQAGLVSHGLGLQLPVQQATMQTKPAKQKKPRAATIRVSRKKQASSSGTQAAESPPRESVVSRSSWLDVWKGRRHNVLWATLDGQLMSLWKKRTDKFTEYVFHMSSITNICKQDRGRFSIDFRKKHFEFLAHSEAVREGWLTSLLAARGTEPPAPPKQHGSLTMKDPRSKVYAAICGHNLWIYNSKEDFSLGLGMTCVSMNVASVKQTGRHSFSLITPYKTFNFSADSSRELAVWVGCLMQGIRSALSCSEVALRLWASPWNKVCADCGCANPEWASINLLVVICEACAGQHRSMGSNRSKVRSLKLDGKVWTEPLIKLFVVYGNKAANDVWGHNVPAAEQILPDATSNQRGAFIKAKYSRGHYRRAHPLASSQKLLNQRLCEVVCGSDVAETLSLLCSGARVHSGDPQCRSAITLAEQAGQAMQTELLRHNEYVEAPDAHQLMPSREQPGLEELHGKLQDERFLFSQENESAACDVLDLREVISVFDLSTGPNYNFEILTLTDGLICSADARDILLSHMLHILRVVLPGPALDEELDGVFAASRVSLREGSGLQHTEVWAALRGGEVLIYPTDPHRHKERLLLSTDTRYTLDSSENTVELVTAERTVSMQFERENSCSSWHSLLTRATSSAERSQRRSLYQLPANASGTVAPVLDRCISHITQHGLKVEGLYRRCGIATKVSQLGQALSAAPATTVLDTDELGIIDITGALKLFLRQQLELIPETQKEHWVKAAAHPDEAVRLAMYRRLVKQLPPDNRVTLTTLCGHLYTVQLYSQENRMTAQNLALVFVPTLFQELAMNTDMVRLTREIIIHHTLVFLSKENEPDLEKEEIITAF